MEKKLYRSTTNKIFGGVCGGLGEYFEIDPVLVRVLTVIVALATGFGLLAYIVAWIIIPRDEEIRVQTSGAGTSGPVTYSSWNKYLPGVILIGLGVILLVRDHWYWFAWDEFWPVALILVGLFLIFRRGRKDAAGDTEAVQANHNQAKPENGGSIA